MNHQFGKEERLKSRKTIQGLFKKGISIKAFPIIAIYLPGQPFEGVKVGFSVSKRKIRSAVDRNLMKRRMLEAYRQNRDSQGVRDLSGVALMLIYVKDELSDFNLVEQKVIRVLNKLGQANCVNDSQSQKN